MREMHRCLSTILSQYEGALHWLTPVILDYAVSKREMGRNGNRNPIAVPHGVYRCRGNDQWCAIAVFTDEEWQAFCQSLWERGLKGSSLRLVVADGASAISCAVTLLWPEAMIQSCVFHKMRNLVFGLKRHPLKKLILKDAKVIWQATSRQEALRRISHFRAKWSKTCPGAVRNFIRDIDFCLSYFHLDPAMWRRIRTNNPLDRFFREIKRRINPMGPFVDRKSASRILFAIAEAYEQDQRKRNRRETKTARAESREITFAHF